MLWSNLELGARPWRGNVAVRSSLLQNPQSIDKPEEQESFLEFISLSRWLITAPQGTRGYLISDKDSRALEEEAKAQGHMLVSQEV